MTRKNSVLVTCAVCGQSFERKPSALAAVNYCSPPCHYRGRTLQAQQRVEQRHGAPIRDVLDRLYNDEQLGIKAIAQRLGISDRVCWNWMKELGIERRTRTEAVRLQWQGNEQRRQEQAQRIRDDMQAGRQDRYRIARVAQSDWARQRNSAAKRGDKNPMAGRKGPLSPQWKGGRIPLEDYGSRWRAIRARIRERDNHQCQICGSPEQLQVHHIEPFRKERKHAFDNLITLCASCHGKVEHGVIECPRPKPKRS